MPEPVWWLVKDSEKFQNYDQDVLKFWVEFVEALEDVVTDDGYVDFTDPECIDAYVGPPYALIKLDARNKAIDIDCAAQAHPPRSFYQRRLRIVDGLGDMNEWAVIGTRTAKECGIIVAKEMFELRNA
jgi:hypothetical protein